MKHYSLRNRKYSLNEKNYTLVGCDGNAFAVMGYVARAMRECHKPQYEIDLYRKQAMESDYNNLLCVSMEILEKLNKENGAEDGAQFDEYLEESYNIHGITIKELSEALKDYEIQEDFDEDDEYIDPAFRETNKYMIPEDAKKILNSAIDEALIKIWDELGIEFSAAEIYEWLKQVIKKYPIENLSIYNLLIDAKHNDEEIF